MQGFSAAFVAQARHFLNILKSQADSLTRSFLTTPTGRYSVLYVFRDA